MSIETEIKGSPSSIMGVADWITGRLAPAIDGAADSMLAASRQAEGEWRGEAADAFGGAMRRGASRVDDGHEAARDVGRVLADYSGELSSLQGRMASIRDDARAVGLTVNGFVITEPGPGPARPGQLADTASRAALAAHDADVAAYDAHQDRIRAYNRLAEHARDVWSDAERAWERVSAQDRALDAASWTFALSDVAGGLAGATLGYNASALRQTAQGFRTNAQQHLARLRSMETYPSRFAQQFYDDLAHYDDVVRSSGDDLARASRLARLGTAVPLATGGVLTGVGIWYDMEHGGESAEQAVASNVGGFAASVAAGAAIGTVVGGPVGTVAGVVVGGVVGVFTSGMIDGLYDFDGDISDAAMAGADALVDTGGALLEGASDVGGAIVDGIGGLFD